jgi:hypothetical protein
MTSVMPTVQELEEAFRVYFDEMTRCQERDCYWALLHVVVGLPDICGALESESGWATRDKYLEWCRTYLPSNGMTPEDYWDMRNLVLHQGRTYSTTGRYYKFTKPTTTGARVHRHVQSSDIFVLDVGKLAEETMAGVRGWFVALQAAGAVVRRAYVGKHLPSLVTVKQQELPSVIGAGGIITQTFNVTHTSTG